MDSLYTLKFQDKQLEDMTLLPEPVRIELPAVLASLRKIGGVTEAEIEWVRELSPNGSLVSTETRRIPARSFTLHYRVDFEAKEITIVQLGVNSLKILCESFSIQSERKWDMTEGLPQCDLPEKLIAALQLIHQGITDSYELAVELGHKAKKRKDIQRHGNYTADALAKLGLIERYKVDKGLKLEAKLTEQGRRIAEAKDPLDRQRYLIESMLNYPPLWQIMQEVTAGHQSLTNELIVNTVIPKEDRDGQTAMRRAKPLRRWVEWIAEMTLIPIHKRGERQLYLPVFCSDGYEQLHAAVRSRLHV
jgi:hypothetical protein